MVSAPPGQLVVKETMEVTDAKQPAAKEAPQAVAAEQSAGGMIVPGQIAFPNGINNNEASEASGSNKEQSEKKHHRHHHRKHRQAQSSKDKDKIATKASNGKHHKRKHRHHEKSTKDGKEKSSSGDGKERKRRHRRRKKDPLRNDPETIKKSQELLLASMGVPKPPDTEPCFASQKTDFESSNPVYQCNKKRFSHNCTPSLRPLTQSGPTISSSLADINSTHHMETSSSADPNTIVADATATSGSSTGIGNGLGPRRGSFMYGHYIEF